MSNNEVHNINVASQGVLVTPEDLWQALPMSDKVRQTVADSRQAIWDILDRKDPRLFVVVGPCSIHDTAAALDYARRLRSLADEVDDTLYIVMRVYFEKPRTTVGWKGLINDPHLDDSFEIEEGLHIGRFKNGTDGGLTVATNALNSVSKPHRFLGINRKGQVSVFTTKGNAHGHIVLRGGSAGPNYDSVHIRLCEQALEKAGLAKNIMVDCSHANSNKQPELQPLVVENVGNQIIEGNQSIVGLMIESNIHAGNQSIPSDLNDLAYGVSVTDGCIDWESTEACLRTLREQVKEALQQRKA